MIVVVLLLALFARCAKGSNEKLCPEHDLKWMKNSRCTALNRPKNNDER